MRINSGSVSGMVSVADTPHVLVTGNNIVEYKTFYHAKAKALADRLLSYKIYSSCNGKTGGIYDTYVARLNADKEHEIIESENVYQKVQFTYTFNTYVEGKELRPHILQYIEKGELVPLTFSNYYEAKARALELPEDTDYWLYSIEPLLDSTIRSLTEYHVLSNDEKKAIATRKGAQSTKKKKWFWL